MLCRIYTFERDTAWRRVPIHACVSIAAVDAINRAIDAPDDIRYEELTDPHNPRPIIAVLFRTPEQVLQMDRFIAAHLEFSGIKVGIMRAPRRRRGPLAPPRAA